MPVQPSRNQRLATLAILAMTAVWGSTFFLIKDLVKVLPTLDFLALRFAIAAVVMVALFWRSLAALGRREWVVGLVIGVFYAAGQILQTFGLERTSATMSGFVTGLYVVITPLLAALVFRDRLGAATWAAVGLALAGLATLSFQGAEGLAFGPGEWLTLASAFMYAGHILALGRFATPATATGLAVVQMIVIGAITGVAALPDGIVLPPTAADWGVVLYMAIVAGAGALWAQTWAQSHIDPSRAAILMTTEPLFAGLFAVTLGGEPLTLQIVTGGSLIVAAMYVVELASRRAPPLAQPHLEI